MNLYELTAVELQDLLRQGELQPDGVRTSFMRRIRALEPFLAAWQYLDEDGATPMPVNSGPLAGVPVGLKDIFHVAGMPTGNGSPCWENFRPAYDSTAAARLRQAGAMILGKTATAQWAFLDPPATRNPWNVQRTPGGSSSGSAAAVAARMLPIAIGTQTGGSILRPAAFCGVVGLKASYGRVSRFGVTPNSWSLDHAGPITRSVADAALALSVLAGADEADPTSTRLEAPQDYIAAAAFPRERPVLAVLRDFVDYSEAAVRDDFEAAAGTLQAAGAELRELSLPYSLDEYIAVRGIINQVETAAIHARFLRQQPDAYREKVTALIRVGECLPADAYLRAQRLRNRMRGELMDRFKGVDALLMPTVHTVVPERSITGSSALQGVWTMYGCPAISLPAGLSADGMPAAIQLVTAPYMEAPLLSVAAWCEQVLGRSQYPAALAAYEQEQKLN